MTISYISSSFDKASYDLGDTVTLTVNYTSTDPQANPNAGSQVYQVGVTATDSSETVTPLGPSVNGYLNGNFGPIPQPLPFTVTVPATEPQPVTITASDGTHTWVVVSNTLTAFDATSGVSSWTVVLTTTIPLD